MAEYISFNLEPLPEGHPDSIDYHIKALKEIKENPDNHGYSVEEVKRVLENELASNQPNEAQLKFQKNLKTIQSLFSNYKEAIQKHRDGLDLILSNFQNLSKYGWYISPSVVRQINFGDLQSLSLLDNDLEIGEQLISQFGSEDKITKVLSLLKRSFPSRESLFEEIRKAYSAKLFSAVVALCYTQADGICNEVWSIGFFDKDRDLNYDLKLHNKLNEHNYGFSNQFIKQLGISENEITMYSKNDFFNNTEIQQNTFNRHLVLHGHSLNYGKQVNALRAILLLEFLDHFVREYRKANELYQEH